MTDVACFCGCVYSFSADVGVCPKCGEYTTLTGVTIEEEREMRRELAAVLDPRGGLVIPDLTVPEFVLERAESWGERQALVDAVSGRALSYRELAVIVKEVAVGLTGRGVRPGDVIALCAPNGIEFVVAWFASLAAGAIVTTANPLSTADEITRQLGQVSARWLLTTAELYEQKLAACARASGVAESFLIGAAAAGPDTIPFESLRYHANGSPAVAIGSSDVAFLPCSSGTTGLPKAVVLTHRSLIASLCQMRLGQHDSGDDVNLAVLPLFHIFGLQVSLNLTLLQGGTVVLMPRFELEGFLRAVQDHRVSRAAVVPPMVLALASSELVDQYDVSSLRVLTVGAAPLGLDLATGCAQRMGCRVKQGYGMTELGGGTHIAPDDGPDRPDCIGPALPGVECRVVDCETAADVGPGEPGELLIRSPSAMRGYLDNPQATDATIDSDGWLHTGDIVTVDTQGWFRVTDRIKELIKYNGFQVAPAELEAILLGHPAVEDAAVVRSPDEVAGEVPKAFIVIRTPTSAEELIAWVAERVAPYKRVRRVEFVDQIPKSPSGKILRRLLIEREEAAEVIAS